MPDAPLEDLIRRYEAGDRDPDLLRQLNDAAWTGFHDPWEQAKPKGRHPVTGELVAAPDFDPKAPRPFTLDTLRRCLATRTPTYFTSSWDTLLVFYRYSQRTDRVVRALYSVEGKKKDILKIRLVGDRRVPAERFDRAFRLCNTWNDSYRWPRAFVEMPKPDKPKDDETDPEPASALLALDYQLYLREGIPQSLFDSLVNDAIATSWDFWELAHDEYGL